MVSTGPREGGSSGMTGGSGAAVNSDSTIIGMEAAGSAGETRS